MTRSLRSVSVGLACALVALSLWQVPAEAGGRAGTARQRPAPKGNAYGHPSNRAGAPPYGAPPDHAAAPASPPSDPGPGPDSEPPRPPDPGQNPPTPADPVAPATGGDGPDDAPETHVLGEVIAADAPPAGAGAELPVPSVGTLAEIPEAPPLDIPAVGSQFHGMWSDYTDQERLEVLDKLAAAGVTWIRLDLGWSSFQESGRNEYSNWYVERADFIVDAARERGMRVLGTLWRTPDWANGGAGTIVPPSDPADYGNFAGWIAEHFRGRVDAWEIWNEPNLDYFFDGSIQEYVGLLRSAYPAIKAGDPEAEVVLGGPAYNDTPWLRQMYEAGGGPFFDVMATHPYQGMADAPPETPDDGTIWTLSHVSNVIDLMNEFGDGGKPIWFTEFGWSSHPNTPDLPNWKRGVTLEQQADFLLRALVYIGNRFPEVTNVFWYNERNRDSGHEYLDNYGLLYRDLSPKPVYEALKAFLAGEIAVEPVPMPREEDATRRRGHVHRGKHRHPHGHPHRHHR